MGQQSTTHLLLSHPHSHPPSSVAHPSLSPTLKHPPLPPQLVEENNVKNPAQLVGRNPHSRLVYFQGWVLFIRLTYPLYSFLFASFLCLLP